MGFICAYLTIISSYRSTYLSISVYLDGVKERERWKDRERGTKRPKELSVLELL